MSGLPPFVSAIARVFGPTASDAPEGPVPVGMACLVAPQRVHTCWHVVKAANPEAAIGTEIMLDFPLVAAGVQCPAQVAAVWKDLDWAALEVWRLPPGVAPAPVADVPTRDLWGHPFRAFGCPPHFADGVWASGVVRGPQAKGRVQLEDTKTEGFRLQPGFSGGPVWDEVLQAVVGLVVATTGNPGPKAALMMPAVRATTKSLTPLKSQPTTPVLPNPFSDLGGLADQSRFFDREDILRRIFDALSKGTNLSLVGEAQVGKSSLLSLICAYGPTQLGRTASDFVYLNMQWGLHTPADFYAALCDALGLPEPLQGYALTRALRGRYMRMVICLDELENLAGAGFTHEIRSHLRGLADLPTAPLQLVTASRVPLAKLFADAAGLSSPLDNICRQIIVPPFDPDTARAFLAHRLDPLNLKFTPEEVDYLLHESGGNPGRLQMLAYEAFERRWGEGGIKGYW